MKMLQEDKFYFKFYENHFVPNYIQNLRLVHNDHLLYQNDLSKTLYYSYNIGLFPSYIDFEIANSDNYNRKKIIAKHIDGCAVALDKFENIEHYILNQFKKNGKFKNRITKSIARLESCFNIRYSMYFGSISRDNYDYLMENLKSMIVSRFSQINKTNFAIKKWDTIKDKCFDLINRQNASLYVIYNNNEPINISLNYHYSNILFGAVSSYDTDYSKFGLGHIMIYKILEWCFKNEYGILDMTHGNLPYKKIWCNINYSFETNVLYRKKSKLGSLLFFIVVNKVHLLNILKEMNIPFYVEKLKRIASKNNEIENLERASLNYSCKIIDAIDRLAIKNLIEITITERINDHLKRPVYDFLYLNPQQLNRIKIYKHSSKDNIYYLKGQNQIMEISYSN